MDGLLDVIDAKSSHKSREEKLEILKDPHTGAFAIIGCGVYFLLYLAAFGEMKSELIPAFAVTFILTRALSGLSVVTFPMAKAGGLAAMFSSAAQKKAVAAVMAGYVVLAEAGIWYLGGFFAAAMTFTVSLFIYVYYYTMAKREFGGITGDLAGYFLQICELGLAAGLAVVSHLI